MVCGLWLAACPGPLAMRPEAFQVSRQEFSLASRTVAATYVKPVSLRHPGLIVAFFTGDAGWLGASGDVFEHLAEQGFYVAGYNSREFLKPIKRAGQRVSIADSAEALEGVFARARRDLGLPGSTPLIVTGVSRGASAVAFTAVHSRLQQNVAGAIAIALTRESDYLRAPDPRDRPSEVQLDAEGRIELYPALQRIGSIPLAVIQSTHDKYVPSAESRRLLGPDTPTRRLYEVEARNHGFAGGREALLNDLDDALGWIESSARKR
jgi:hypothetical protein